MPRTRYELEVTKDRLSRAIKLMQEELNSVVVELAALDGPTKLDQIFFWERLVPILLQANGGLLSAEIHDRLTGMGFTVSPNSLRVFLSRCKDRGSLELSSGGQRASRWRVSTATIEQAVKLGLRPEWFAG